MSAFKTRLGGRETGCGKADTKMALTISKKCMAIAPSVTLAISAKAKELRAQGIDVIGFGVGEPDFDTPKYICDAAKRAIDAGCTRYTPVAGVIELRQAIVQKLKKDNGLDYQPDQIIVSNGAKHTLFTALSAIIDPGDEVLIPAPAWVSYPEMVAMTGGVPVLVQACEAQDYLVTIDQLRAALTPRTKAIIINTPNNPNGNVMPRALLKQIADFAVENALYVISDEIYEKLIYDGAEHVSIASLGDDIKAQTIVVNGVSKTYAMTGWRIGYAAGPLDVVKAMTRFQSHATSNANSIAQMAAAEALKNGEKDIAAMVAEFDARRVLMHGLINGIDGLSANKPMGAFYAMMNISRLIGKRFSGEEITGSVSFSDLLLKYAHVAVTPAKAFGADDHVRLSYAVDRKSIEEGLKRIAGFVAGLE